MILCQPFSRHLRQRLGHGDVDGRVIRVHPKAVGSDDRAGWTGGSRTHDFGVVQRHVEHAGRRRC